MEAAVVLASACVVLVPIVIKDMILGAETECKQESRLEFKNQPKNPLRSFQKQGNTSADPHFRVWSLNFRSRKKKEGEYDLV